MTFRATPCPRAFAAVAFLGLLAGCQPATDATPAEAGASPPAAAADAAGDAASATAAAPAPLPDAREAVNASMARFRQLRSFHASMRIEGAPQGTLENEMDYVAPDRYRMRMRGPGMEVTQTLVGDTMYMTRDGQTMEMPVPAGMMEKFRDPAWMARQQEGASFESQGRDTIDGRSAHKVLMRQAQPVPADVTLWLGDDGLPLQAIVRGEAEGRPTTTTIRYSRFDDPTLAVQPPQG
jgi:hypothetical protein